MADIAENPIARYTRGQPCPICGNHDSQVRGKGIRCHGYRSGSHAFCARVKSESEGPKQTWRHELGGDCGCGQGHELPTDSSERATRKQRRDPGWSPRAVDEAIYPYVDEHRVVLAELCRHAGKRFRWRRPDPERAAAYIEGMGDLREAQLPLYGLPWVSTAVEAHQPILWVEGEKCARAVSSLALTATTIAGGADARPQPHHLAPLVGANVFVVPDADEAGARYGDGALAALNRAGIRANMVYLDAPRRGYDVSDWINDRRAEGVADHAIARRLLEICAAGEEAQPEENLPVLGGVAFEARLLE